MFLHGAVECLSRSEEQNCSVVSIDASLLCSVSALLPVKGQHLFLCHEQQALKSSGSMKFFLHILNM